MRRMRISLVGWWNSRALHLVDYLFSMNKYLCELDTMQPCIQVFDSLSTSQRSMPDITERKGSDSLSENSSSENEELDNKHDSLLHPLPSFINSVQSSKNTRPTMDDDSLAVWILSPLDASYPSIPGVPIHPISWEFCPINSVLPSPPKLLCCHLLVQFLSQLPPVEVTLFA